MTTMAWSTWETPGDHLEYVNQISDSITHSIPLYLSTLANPDHFTYFCDSFILSFIPLLREQVYKCRMISDAGVTQLIVDFTSLKALLLEIPNMGRLEPEPIPSRYKRQIDREMLKIESSLKVILNPPATMVETFKTLIPEGTLSEFQKIVELKGLNRNDSLSLLSQFQGQQPSSDSSGKLEIPGTNPSSTAPKSNSSRLLNFVQPITFANMWTRNPTTTTTTPAPKT